MDRALPRGSAPDNPTPGEAPSFGNVVSSAIRCRRVLFKRRARGFANRCQGSVTYLGLHTLRERLHEAGLAQTGLPHHEKDLAHPLLSLLPTIFQQTEFGIA